MGTSFSSIRFFFKEFAENLRRNPYVSFTHGLQVVMSLMILEGRSMHDQQTFFSNHLATWLERFFADLRAARSAVFYRAVGRFAAAFTAFEAAYLGMGPAAPKQP